MNVLKMGTSHKEMGINCQDATGQFGNRLKVVCDGCSEGAHTEVGAKLFCKMLIDKYANFVNKGKRFIDVPALMRTVFDELVQLIGDNPQDIKDYLSFTIIVAENIPDSLYSYVYYCGDGYYLLESEYGVGFKKLDCGEYPEYLAYNYVDGGKMKQYSDGVTINMIELEDGFNIGVASDGIRFVADLDDDNPIKKEFRDILSSGKDMKMKLFFNRNASIFQDDFSIVL